jgi:hypothetical protein
MTPTVAKQARAEAQAKYDRVVEQAQEELHVAMRNILRLCKHEFRRTDEPNVLRCTACGAYTIQEEKA